MRIQVIAVGTLKAMEKGSRMEILEVPPGSSVGMVMEKLELQGWEVGFIKVNGQPAAKESVLKENDEVILIAPLVGG